MKNTLIVFVLVAVAIGIYMGFKKTTGTPYAKPASEQTEVEQTNSTPSVSGVSIDLRGQNLTKVPDYVFDATGTEILDISYNELSGALQSQVGQLKKLRSLNMSYNNFTGVPAEVGQLQNLEILDLSYNKLTGLPNELGNLSNLKLLKLTGNSYSQQDLEVIKSRLPKTTVIEI